MSKAKTKYLKIKLGKFNRRTRWAPLWAVVKRLGRLLHPSVITRIKRHWRKGTKIRKTL